MNYCYRIPYFLPGTSTEDRFDAVRLRPRKGWVRAREVWSSECAFFSSVALGRGGWFTGKVRQVSGNVICGFGRNGVVIFVPRLGEGGGLSFCVNSNSL